MPSENWRDPWYWRWWWHQRAPFVLKVVLAVVLCSPMVAYVALQAENGSDAARPLAPAADAPVAMFAEDFDDTLRSESILYDRWKKLNPVEAAAYERYADAVRIGIPARPPVAVVTPLGRALVAAATIASRSTTAASTAAANE